MTGSSGGRAGATAAGATAGSTTTVVDRSAVRGCRRRPDAADRGRCPCRERGGHPDGVPHLPAVRGRCAAWRSTIARRRQVERVRGDLDDVFSHGFICPKGSTVSPAPTRTPTGCASRRPGRRPATATWRSAGTRRSPRSSAGCSRSSTSTAVRRWPSTWATRTCTTLGPRCTGLLGAGAGHPQRVLGQHGRPDAQARVGRLPVRQLPDDSRCPTSTAPTISCCSAPTPGSPTGAWPPPPTSRGGSRPSERGGRVVVVDPRRTKTAANANEHVAIRPGTDAHLLAAMIHVLFAEDLVDPGRLAPSTGHRRGRAVPGHGRGVHARGGGPPVTGIDAEHGPARWPGELADAPTAAVYGRIGTCTQALRHDWRRGWSTS